MRRGVFFFAVFFIGLFSVNQLNAQYQYIPEPASSLYDTLYVFDTTYIANCFQSIDSARLEYTGPNNWWIVANIPYARPFAEFAWYSALKRDVCDPTAPVPDGYVVGANTYASGFAQKYHLDSMPDSYVVCGVAIKLWYGSLDIIRELCILDSNLDTLATTIFHTVNVIPPPYTGSAIPWNQGGWNLYYFDDESQKEGLSNINDFHIAFDVPMYGEGNWFRVAHTCNVYSPCIYEWIMEQGGPFAAGYNYDSIRFQFFDHWDWLYPHFRDTINNTWITPESVGWQAFRENAPDTVIPLCSYPDDKYILRNGEWVNFVDDPVYEIYRNIYIAMVPIIMVPKTIQSLSEAELAKMCYLYPNPTRESFRVLSHYNIESVQVFDVSGRQVRAQSVRHFETTIDVRDLPQGTYIVKIHTSKGIDEKKLILQ